jgi:hypothetical protein
MSLTVMAYQWGWNYFFPGDTILKLRGFSGGMQQTQQSDQTAESLVVSSKYRCLRRVSPYYDYFATKAPDFISGGARPAIEARPPRPAAALDLWNADRAAAAEGPLTTPRGPCAADPRVGVCQPAGIFRGNGGCLDGVPPVWGGWWMRDKRVHLFNALRTPSAPRYVAALTCTRGD